MPRRNNSISGIGIIKQRSAINDQARRTILEFVGKRVYEKKGMRKV